MEDEVNPSWPSSLASLDFADCFNRVRDYMFGIDSNAGSLCRTTCILYCFLSIDLVTCQPDGYQNCGYRANRLHPTCPLLCIKSCFDSQKAQSCAHRDSGDRSNYEGVKRDAFDDVGSSHSEILA